MPRILASLRALARRSPAPAEPEEPHQSDHAAALRQRFDALVSRAVDDGVLHPPHVLMLRRLLDLADTTAGDVMTPRTEVVGIREGTAFDEAVSFILENGHSRYPVFREAIDNVTGVVLARDVWRAQVDGHTDLAALTRAPLYVPDSKPVDELLREMQNEQTHMAIVVDEFGGTAGVATIEDVIEEIVGEIADELDDAPPAFESGEDGELLFPGNVAIAELNDRFALDLPDEDFTTVGGFVVGRLGRMAQVGDEVTLRGGELRVVAVRKRRIERLALRLHPPAA